jgi:hypothetical protein
MFVLNACSEVERLWDQLKPLYTQLHWWVAAFR